MVVQHNLTAMNANRMLGITTNAQAKSSEKLSSGYRINRAADDAAGLTISEKMRKQIRGLDQASSNAEDGVSAVQTAEGALTEVHSMLQRMNELAVQAANGTNSESDMQAIQDEIEQLTTEIDRVAETTKFNETYLLKGNGTSGTKTLNAHDAGLAGSLVDNEDGTSTFTADALDVGSTVTIAGKEYTIVDSATSADYTDVKTYSGATWTSGDKITTTSGDTYIYYTQNATDANDKTVAAAGWYQDGDSTSSAVTASTIIVEGNTLTSGGVTTTLYGNSTTTYTADTLDNVIAAIKATTTGTVTIADNASATGTSYTIATTSSSATSLTADDIVALVEEGQYVAIGTSSYYYVLPAASSSDSEISKSEAYKLMAQELATASSIGADVKATVANNGDGTFTITQGTVAVDNALSFNLHVGADADMTNKISVDISSMSAAGIGIKGLTVTSETEATYAIDAIADAIATVSAQRSALGAVQNRLEHTIANLDNVVENTTSAESRIRDTDMAEEMVEYSKNNILAQAGQSMLAQANQSTQGVLSLLQ